jgi:integrase/recombinase XerC
MAATPREQLMLRLAAEMGLRRAEVAVIHSRDIFEDMGGHSLTVHGKGGKERDVPLPPGLASQIRAEGTGYLFPGDDAGHLSPRWVGKLVTLLLPDELTMHTLRHRFATRAYAVDKDVFVVQELLGHASPATTRRYVLVPRDGLRRTVLAVA